MEDYVTYIRALVGHKPIIITYAGGVLFNDKREVLLQKRSDFNQWGLPGGMIEYDETACEACVREFKEETGLTVTIDQLLGVNSNGKQEYPNGDVAKTICICFEVTMKSGRLSTKSDETLALKFFSLDKLPKIFNDQHQYILENIRKGITPFFD